AALHQLLDSLASGGLLLAVYHDLDDEHREQMKARGVDPADYYSCDDLAASLGDDFTVERHALEPRVDPSSATLTVCGVLLCAHLLLIILEIVICPLNPHLYQKVGF